jgi:hypothetical protein
MDASLWIGASHRVDNNRHVVQALSDAAWLSLLIAWPILAVQMLATAVITLRDQRATPTFPRWLSWASIICGWTPTRSTCGVRFDTRYGRLPPNPPRPIIGIPRRR